MRQRQTEIDRQTDKDRQRRRDRDRQTETVLQLRDEPISSSMKIILIFLSDAYVTAILGEAVEVEEGERCRSGMEDTCCRMAALWRPLVVDIPKKKPQGVCLRNPRNSAVSIIYR